MPIPPPGRQIKRHRLQAAGFTPAEVEVASAFAAHSAVHVAMISAADAAAAAMCEAEVPFPPAEPPWYYHLIDVHQNPARTPH